MIDQNGRNVKTRTLKTLTSVSPTALGLFAIIGCANGPVTQKWVQDQVDIDRRTAKKYLHELLDRGWLDHPSKQQWLVSSRGSEVHTSVMQTFAASGLLV